MRLCRRTVRSTTKQEYFVRSEKHKSQTAPIEKTKSEGYSLQLWKHENFFIAKLTTYPLFPKNKLPLSTNDFWALSFLSKEQSTQKSLVEK